MAALSFGEKFPLGCSIPIHQLQSLSAVFLHFRELRYVGKGKLSPCAIKVTSYC